MGVAHFAMSILGGAVLDGAQILNGAVVGAQAAENVHRGPEAGESVHRAPEAAESVYRGPEAGESVHRALEAGESAHPDDENAASRPGNDALSPRRGACSMESPPEQKQKMSLQRENLQVPHTRISYRCPPLSAILSEATTIIGSE
jgi:hypothetical protein